MASFQETFPGRVNSSRGDINWPPRSSCYLTPLDFCFVGYVKDHIYADKPSTLEHLKTNIRQIIAEISPNMSQTGNRKLHQKNQYLQHFVWRSCK